MRDEGQGPRGHEGRRCRGNEQTLRFTLVLSLESLRFVGS